MLGVYSLLRQEAPAAYKEKWLTLKTMVLDLANRYVAYASSSAFGVPMGMEKTDFVWGSNSFAANHSILLLNAFRYTNDARYQTAALANADYLLGRNATGYCFVTGFGGKSPMRPHHRPSVADGITEPVPGFLVGGPNPFRQDGCVYAFTETETAYTDDDCSYASNEIAINWNAPAVYLFAGISNHVSTTKSGKLD
jgi:endoglucanase